MYANITSLGITLNLSNKPAVLLYQVGASSPSSGTRSLYANSYSSVVFFTFTKSSLIFGFSLSFFRFHFLYVVLTYQCKSPFPTVTLFLTHLKNIYDVALTKSSHDNNSQAIRVKGLLKKISGTVQRQIKFFVCLWIFILYRMFNPRHFIKKINQLFILRLC